MDKTKLLEELKVQMDELYSIKLVDGKDTRKYVDELNKKIAKLCDKVPRSFYYNQFDCIQYTYKGSDCDYHFEIKWNPSTSGKFFHVLSKGKFLVRKQFPQPDYFTFAILKF